jgi:hypothetical protein
MSPNFNGPRNAAMLAVCLVSATSSGASADGTQSLVARARKAIKSDWTRTHSAIVARGDATLLGQKGTLEMRLQADGRFVRRARAKLGEAIGFDGRRLWAEDWTGMPRELQLTDRDWHHTIMAVVSGAWLRPGFPFELSPAPAAEGTGPGFELRREGSAYVLTLRLDAATGLPASLSRTTMQGETRVEFSDYVDAGGSRLPRRIEDVTPGQETVFHVQEYEAVAREAASVADAAFAMPPDPDDVRFDTAVPARIEVRRAKSGHFLVNPRINGKDVGWFIFDSGAGGAGISPSVAETLRLSSVGDSGIMSIFGFSRTKIRAADTFTLGPITIERPYFFEFDLSPFEEAFGQPVVGVVGFDVLRRAVVEVEVAGSMITIHDPKTFDAGKLPWQPLLMNDRHPIVEATFEDHRGLFKLDLGASGGPHGNVSMHAPAVERLKLIEGREVQHADLGGSKVAVGPASSFELAGHRFDSPTVILATGAENSPFRDAVTLGNIGVNFMEPFRIVFDYGRQRIAMAERTAD